MQSGRSASAVGDAATSAVVTAIVAIIAAAGIYSAVFYVLGW
jgi:phospholipid/cholesterol/gamma-HCH transport system permease protein